MKSHSTPTFVFFVLFITTTLTLPAPNPESESEDVKVKKNAVSKWIAKTFLDIYSIQLLPHPDDVKEGEEVYKKLVNPGITRESGVLHNQNGASLKTTFDKWEKDGLISKIQAEELSVDILEDGGSIRPKVVRTTLLQRPSNANQIVFGIIGLAGVSSSTYTLPFSFSTLSFKSPPEVWVSESGSRKCFTWGIYCHNSFQVTNESGDEALFLFEYLRDGGIRDFVAVNNASVLGWVNAEAYRVEGSLPSEVQENVKSLYNSEGKAWDQVLEKDPLRWDDLF